MWTRRLGRSGIEVSALGLGTARIGGIGWTEKHGQSLDDPAVLEESLRAIRRAMELGVTFFDTADEYGCGHAERILGQALGERRDEMVIATKFGYTFDEETREVTGTAATADYIRRACEASLRRLGRDSIDLYLFHLRDYPLEQAGEVRDTLEALVEEGLIRAYGWSTDDVERARFFAEGPHCTAVMHRLNIMMDNEAMLALCEQYDLASVNRIPLAMGVLSGAFPAKEDLDEGDWRRAFFEEERFLADLERIERMRPLLTGRGHTPVQAALGWIWARSDRAIPVPGFRTVPQVEELATAAVHGPLDETQMEELSAV